MSAQFRIICPTYWYPGSATDMRAIYVHDITRHLVQRGHRVCVVTPAGTGAPLRDTLDGVEIHRFPLAVPEDLAYGKVAQSKVGLVSRMVRMQVMVQYLWRQYRAMLDCARDFKPDVVHGHWAIPTGPALVYGSQKLRIPSVITMHGGDVYVNKAEGYDFPTRPYVKPVLHWTLTRASALTAISDDCVHHALRAGASMEKIHLIMNGADLRRFSPSGETPDRPYGNKMVFACRQLFPRKGIRYLIQAVARLRPQHPDIRLVLAGDGFERAELEALADKLGVGDITTFLGWVVNSDLPKYFRACAVSVIPSLEEGFGIPAAEAMGCEVPVVATDAGGLPEVVANGETGFVVPKADANALAEAIGKLLTDSALAHRMGKAGRQRALERFDWMRSAERFEELYTSLLSPAGVAS
ncbi:MAG TPA: glycosyltransferase [Steroidobacteraceae bacterium]|jgi:glycosyltransferase involved in cell wall biosynthesis|nr:glycosyltransferase [Steroidobacteraceae bacterium]